jgi:hypothetical protein
VGPASPLLAPLMPGRCRHLRRLKRAGLDYWDWVCTDVHSGWGDFMQHVRAQPGEQRLVAFTKFGGRHYAEEGLYRCPGATTWLLFGSETFGLPPEVGAWPCPRPCLALRCRPLQQQQQQLQPPMVLVRPPRWPLVCWPDGPGFCRNLSPRGLPKHCCCCLPAAGGV